MESLLSGLYFYIGVLFGTFWNETEMVEREMGWGCGCTLDTAYIEGSTLMQTSW